MRVKLKKVKLEPEARRGDLTVREMVSILGGLIGSLCENAPPDRVRDAITWWATIDVVWLSFGGEISSKIQALIKKRLEEGGMSAVGLSDLIADIATKE